MRDGGAGRRVLGGIVAAYLLVAMAFLPAYRDQLGTDQIAYLQLAQRWADLEWAKAVSSHWSPMVSWLTAPLLWVGVDPPLAALLVSIVAGAAVIVLVGVLVRRWGLDRRASIVALVAVAGLALGWALTQPFPADLLSVAAVLWVLCALPLDRRVSGRRALLIGALVGFAYLVKAFLLPFLVVGLALLAAAAWWTGSSEERRAVGRTALLGGAGLLAIAGPWILVLSLTYDSPTVSSAGSYNLGVEEPGDPDTSPFLLRAQPLPHDDSVTAWEDPARNEPLSWNPLASTDDVRHYAGLVRSNLEVAQSVLFDFSVFAAAVVGAGLVAFVARPGRRRELALLVGGTILFVLGYSLVYIDPRYLLPALTLVALTGSVLLAIGQEARIRPAALWVASALWLVSLLYGPAVAVISNVDTGGVTAPSAASWSEVREMARDLEGRLPEGTRLVGAHVDGVGFAHVVCVETSAVCLGGYDGTDRARTALADQDVDAILVPRQPEAEASIPDGFRPDPALDEEVFRIWVRD